MEALVLGPLEVRVDGRPVSVGGPKQRAVLALLLLNANRVVSRDRLVEGLWGERAPPTAGRSLDSYVSRLRALLGPDRIERRAPGYALRVAPGELDLERFETLLEDGRASLAAGDAATAGDLLRRALALWRGTALADLLYEPFAAARWRDSRSGGCSGSRRASTPISSSDADVSSSASSSGSSTRTRSASASSAS